MTLARTLRSATAATVRGAARYVCEVQDPTPDALRLAAVPGEGIGPEVVEAALTVLEAACEVTGIPLDVTWACVIGAQGPDGF